MPELSETRAADRAKMAAIIKGIVEACGGKCEQQRKENGDIRLEVTGGHGIFVGIELRRRSPHARPNTFVLSWNVRGTPKFAVDQFGYDAVNPHHFHKATSVPQGFEALKKELQSVLERARDGSLFQPGTLPPTA